MLQSSASEEDDDPAAPVSAAVRTKRCCWALANMRAWTRVHTRSLTVAAMRRSPAATRIGKARVYLHVAVLPRPTSIAAAIETTGHIRPEWGAAAVLTW